MTDGKRKKERGERNEIGAKTSGSQTRAIRYPLNIMAKSRTSYMRERGSPSKVYYARSASARPILERAYLRFWRNVFFRASVSPHGRRFPAMIARQDRGRRAPPRVEALNMSDLILSRRTLGVLPSLGRFTLQYVQTFRAQLRHGI